MGWWVGNRRQKKAQSSLRTRKCTRKPHSHQHLLSAYSAGGGVSLLFRPGMLHKGWGKSKGSTGSNMVNTELLRGGVFQSTSKKAGTCPAFTLHRNKRGLFSCCHCQCPVELWVPVGNPWHQAIFAISCECEKQVTFATSFHCCFHLDIILSKQVCQQAVTFILTVT